MSEILLPRIRDFQPKRLADARLRLFTSGTLEFIYETGDTAAKIVRVLSDPASGYSLSEAETHPMKTPDGFFTVEKRDVFRDGECEKRIAVLEVQKDAAGTIHGVFLGISGAESPNVAKLVRMS